MRSYIFNFLTLFNWNGRTFQELFQGTHCHVSSNATFKFFENSQTGPNLRVNLWQVAKSSSVFQSIRLTTFITFPIIIDHDFPSVII